MSLAQGTIQKYTEQFKKPGQFASINGQIVSLLCNQKTCCARRKCP